MRVRIAALADYASISLGEKLNILGIFSNIMATAEPIVHPQMQLVVQMEFEASEAGNKTVRVVLNDDDGRQVLELGGEMVVPRAANFQPVTVNQIFVFNNATFPKFGGYEFQVLVNDDVRAEIPLTVVQAGSSTPAAPN